MRRSLSISAQVGLAVSLLTAILTAVLAAMVYLQFQNELEARRAALSHATETLILAVESQVERYAVVGRLLARSPALKTNDIHEFESEARRAALDQPGAWILLADPDGKQIFNTFSPVLEKRMVRSKVAMLAQRRAFETRIEQISDVGIGPAVDLPVLSINFPVMRDGLPMYCLAIIFSPTVFQPLMKNLPNGWLAGIIDSQGNFVARSLQNEEMMGRPASSGWRTVMTLSGFFEFASLEGDALIQSQTYWPKAGWSSAVAVKRSALYGPLWRQLALSTIIGWVAVAACIGLMLSLRRRIANALAVLKLSILSLQQQTPRQEFTGEPEVDALIDEVNIAADALAKNETERFEHERQMIVASGEVNHRAKNLLTVAQSIALLLSKDSVDLPTFYKRFGDRLQALSACQDLLIQRSWQDVDLESIIRSQLAPFATDRYDVKGEPFAIPAAKVQSCSMIFHELATNALKHGALSVESGRIVIEWALIPRLNHQRGVSLAWQEHGGPAVSEPARRGFGTNVIKSSVQQALNGTLNVAFRREGLFCSMEIVVAQSASGELSDAKNI